jgi:hypothetical protein
MIGSRRLLTGIHVTAALVLAMSLGSSDVRGDENTAPILDEIPLQICTGTTLTFTAHAVDAEAPPQTLVYTLINAPAGASINPSTGVFTWSPSTLQNRQEYFVPVRVTDSGTPALSAQVIAQIWVAQPGVCPGDYTASCKKNYKNPADHTHYTCLCNGSGSGCTGEADGCSDAGTRCQDH